MKKKVLYIDDVEDYREQMRDIFEVFLSDVEVQTAETGDVGIGIVEDGFVPHLVLLDLHSSGGTIQGTLKTLAQLRRIAPDATIVAYTDDPNRPTEELLNMGFDDHCSIKGRKMRLGTFTEWLRNQLG